MPRTDLMELSLNLTECISIRKTISENLNIEIRSQLVLGFLNHVSHLKLVLRKYVLKENKTDLYSRYKYVPLRIYKSVHTILQIEKLLKYLRTHSKNLQRIQSFIRNIQNPKVLM